MTFNYIVTQEDANTDSIWLYREGMFLKAYERSAFFVYTRIKDFKLSRRFIKSINREIISLGFPHQVCDKWMHGMVSETIGDKIVRYRHRFEFSEVDYHNWRETIAVNVGDRYTPYTAVIEKTPLYKTSYDLFIQVMTFSKNISKNASNPLGTRAKELAYNLSYSIRRLYDSSDMHQSIETSLAICEELKYLLQVLKDLKEISLQTFAFTSEMAISVSKQLHGLHGKVTAKVHEG